MLAASTIAAHVEIVAGNAANAQKVRAKSSSGDTTPAPEKIRITGGKIKSTMHPPNAPPIERAGFTFPRNIETGNSVSKSTN